MISAIDNLTGLPARTGVASADNSVLGKDDFLLLLVEQMKAQDPLNPQDPSEFTAQLAQFSSLEQLFNLGSSLQDLTLLSASMNNTSAANFIGREVVTDGSQIAVAGGRASGLRYDLGAEASSVTIHIEDRFGNTVKSISLGPAPKGESRFEWDGVLDNGNPAEDGIYSARVEAVDGAGQSILAQTYRTGLVTGIHFENGITLLEMDGQRIPIADIRSVRILESEE